MQDDGHEYLIIKQGDVPGMTYTQVKDIALPGILETTGQVTFDDKKVSTIVSRVQGRIEDVRVSLWDNVARGEPIVKLYSPDYMTAEAEYLQALATSKVNLRHNIDGSARPRGFDGAAARRKLELLGMKTAEIGALSAPRRASGCARRSAARWSKNQVVRGAAVNPGDVLIPLGMLEPIWITADIYEDDLARVHIGQQLEAVTTAFPDRDFQRHDLRASVPTSIPPRIPLQIRCAVRNPGAEAEARDAGAGRILTSAGGALVVPQEPDLRDRRLLCLCRSRQRTLRPPQGRDRVVERSRARRACYRASAAGERVVTGETLQVNALWHEAHGESS